MGECESMSMKRRSYWLALFIMVGALIGSQNVLSAGILYVENCGFQDLPPYLNQNYSGYFYDNGCSTSPHEVGLVGAFAQPVYPFQLYIGNGTGAHELILSGPQRYDGYGGFANGGVGNEYITCAEVDGGFGWGYHDSSEVTRVIQNGNVSNNTCYTLNHAVRVMYMNSTYAEIDVMSTPSSSWTQVYAGVLYSNATTRRIAISNNAFCFQMSANNVSYTAVHSAMACNETVTMSCDVRDTNGGLPPVEVTNLIFNVNGKAYTATRTSGTNTNGTWSANVSPIMQGGPTQFTLGAVSATNSIGTTCSFSPSGSNTEFISSTCTVSFSEQRSIGVDCPCENTAVLANLAGVPNVCTSVNTPSLGCESQSVTSTTTACDWCDPNWQPSYSYCSVDLSADNPFEGVSRKTYTGNASCCTLTGLAEDCMPPIDSNINVPCVLDFCATGGGDSLGSNRAQQDNTLISSTPERYETIVTAATLYGGGPVIKPLIFDINGDGISETILFENEQIGMTNYSRMKVFNNPQMSSVLLLHNMTTNYGRVKLLGQPSLFGFGAYGRGKYVWDQGVLNGSYGLGVAAVVKDYTTGNDMFGTWRFEGGTFVWKGGFVLDGQGSSGGVGVNCFVDDCYFMDKAGTFYRADAPYVSHDSVDSSQLGVVVPVLNFYTIDSLPVLMVYNESSEPTSVAVEGFQNVNGSDHATIFICSLNMSVCEDILVSGINPGKISRLVSGEFGGGESSLYFTTMSATEIEGVYDRGMLWTMKVNESTLLSTDVTNAILSAVGGTIVSVSDPATAKCIGGVPGVAVASHWNDGGNEYTEYACYVVNS